MSDPTIYPITRVVAIGAICILAGGAACLWIGGEIREDSWRAEWRARTWWGKTRLAIAAPFGAPGYLILVGVLWIPDGLPPIHREDHRHE